MPTPLVLESSALTDIDAPVSGGVEIVPLHIVAYAAEVPTLVDGRPQ